MHALKFYLNVTCNFHNAYVHIYSNICISITAFFTCFMIFEMCFYVHINFFSNYFILQLIWICDSFYHLFDGYLGCFSFLPVDVMYHVELCVASWRICERESSLHIYSEVTFLNCRIYASSALLDIVVPRVMLL